MGPGMRQPHPANSQTPSLQHAEASQSRRMPLIVLAGYTTTANDCHLVAQLEKFADLLTQHAAYLLGCIPAMHIRFDSHVRWFLHRMLSQAARAVVQLAVSHRRGPPRQPQCGSNRTWIEAGRQQRKGHHQVHQIHRQCTALSSLSAALTSLTVTRSSPRLRRRARPIINDISTPEFYPITPDATVCHHSSLRRLLPGLDCSHTGARSPFTRLSQPHRPTPQVQRSPTYSSSCLCPRHRHRQVIFIAPSPRSLVLGLSLSMSACEGSRNTPAVSRIAPKISQHAARPKDWPPRGSHCRPQTGYAPQSRYLFERWRFAADNSKPEFPAPTMVHSKLCKWSRWNLSLYGWSFCVDDMLFGS